MGDSIADVVAPAGLKPFRVDDNPGLLTPGLKQPWAVGRDRFAYQSTAAIVANRVNGRPQGSSGNSHLSKGLVRTVPKNLKARRVVISHCHANLLAAAPCCAKS